MFLEYLGNQWFHTEDSIDPGSSESEHRQMRRWLDIVLHASFACLLVMTAHLPSKYFTIRLIVFLDQITFKSRQVCRICTHETPTPINEIWRMSLSGRYIYWSFLCHVACCVHHQLVMWSQIQLVGWPSSPGHPWHPIVLTTLPRFLLFRKVASPMLNATSFHDRVQQSRQQNRPRSSTTEDTSPLAGTFYLQSIKTNDTNVKKWSEQLPTHTSHIH